MRIAQVLLDGAPFYERKSQAIDAAVLAGCHQIVSLPDGAQVLHVYAHQQFPASRLNDVKIPYVANGRPSCSMFRPQPREPVRSVLPFGPDPVPEAVAEPFFTFRSAHLASRSPRTIGSLRRAAGDDRIRLATLSRIARFRDDVDWKVFSTPPTPQDLAAVDLWVDATEDPGDLDGFCAEAIVIGVPVVASRTPVNEVRLVDGLAGLLVPPADPNELTHAILTALYKMELSRPRVDYGLSTRERFRSSRRVERLVQIYEELIA